MFIFDNVSNKQEKNTPKDHACQGIRYTFVEKYNFPNGVLYKVCRTKRTVKIFFVCIFSVHIFDRK